MRIDNGSKPRYIENLFHRFESCLRPMAECYRLFLRVSIFLILTLTSLSAYAGDIAEKNDKTVYVTVITSLEVQEQLKKLDSQIQTQLEEAIKVGNKFIQLRFNDDDRYFADDPNGEEEWNKNLAPLVAMSGEDWQEYREDRWKIVDGNRMKGAHYLVTCPKVELVEVNKTTTGSTLVYSANIIGAFPDLAARKKLQVDRTRAEKPYILQINIGDNKRVLSECSVENILAISYFNYMSHLDNYEGKAINSIKHYNIKNNISPYYSSKRLAESAFANIHKIKKQLESLLSACTNP